MAVGLDHPLVAAYLHRLNGACGGLPPSRREELTAELRAHVAEALAASGRDDESAVRDVLDRLGDPEEIVAAELDQPAARFGAGVDVGSGGPAGFGSAAGFGEHFGVAAPGAPGAPGAPRAPGAPAGPVSAGAGYGSAGSSYGNAAPGSGSAAPGSGSAAPGSGSAAPGFGSARSGSGRPAPAAWGPVEILAVLGLTLGTLIIPVVGLIAGLVFVWVSQQWTRREKIVATLWSVVGTIVLVGGAAAFLLGARTVSTDGSPVQQAPVGSGIAVPADQIPSEEPSASVTP